MRSVQNKVNSLDSELQILDRQVEELAMLKTNGSADNSSLQTVYLITQLLIRTKPSLCTQLT